MSCQSQLGCWIAMEVSVGQTAKISTVLLVEKWFAEQNNILLQPSVECSTAAALHCASKLLAIYGIYDSRSLAPLMEGLLSHKMMSTAGHLLSVRKQSSRNSNMFLNTAESATPMALEHCVQNLSATVSADFLYMLFLILDWPVDKLSVEAWNNCRWLEAFFVWRRLSMSRSLIPSWKSGLCKNHVLCQMDAIVDAFNGNSFRSCPWIRAVLLWESHLTVLT